jgi:soluble lytic murein transglycosylase
MLDDLVGSMRPGSDTACQARFLIGKSFTKLRRHGEAAPHYDAIASQCSDGDLVVRALYNVARGLWTIDRNADAFDRFRQIWTRFPGSTYADDALLQAARLRRDEGATVEADALLDQLLESYPAGDMRPDALWLRMVEKLHAEDYRGAVALADGVATNPGETDLYSRGRIAYFRARALEGLNLTNEARAGFQQVMRDSPMGYYALLALNRLQAIDRAGARALVEELRTPSDKTEGFIGVRPEVARNEHFRSGVLLLRLGLFDLASSELGQLKADFPNDNEVGWLVAFLYDKVGDYQRSHLVPGKRLDVSLAYPAGSNLDRWHIAFPRPFVDEVNRRSRERRLDPFIVYAIMREESGFSPSIESWANAYGLLQLMLPTANDMAKATGRGRVTARQLFDPTVNIELGTMFMKTLSDAFDGHPALVIGGYNGGAANVRRWIRENGRMPFDLWVEEIPYSQTREYVKRVTMSYWIYRWLYAESDPWVTLPWSLTALMPSGRTN